MSKVVIRKIQQLTGHNAAVYALAAGPEPETFFSAAGDGWIVQWSFSHVDEKGELLGQLVAKVEAQVFSLAFVPTTKTIVAGDMNGGVHWINLQEDRPNRHISHHKKGTFGFELVHDHLVSYGGDGIITRWDTLRQSSVESLHLSSQSIRKVIYSESVNAFFVGASDNTIHRIGADDLAIQGALPEAHSNSVFALATSPVSPGILFSGGRDAQLKRWTIGESLVQQDAQPAHWYTINDLLFSPSGKLLFSASRDKTIRIWDSATFKLLMTLDTIRDGGHVNSVNRLLWIAGTNKFVSASDDRSMILWEVEEG